MLNNNDILKLVLSNKINNKNILKVNNEFESLDNFLNSEFAKKIVSNFVNDIFDKNFLIQLEDSYNNQLELLNKFNIKLISINDNNYPFLLKKIEDPPSLLFVAGELYSSDAVSISIVGTRKPSQYGKLAAEKFAKELSENKIIITSGLAYGIDTIAHKSVLAADGITYAVIASGIDQIYSDFALRTSQEILDKNGAIISIYPMGVKAIPFYFLNRNRIISGISKATIVIESAVKGGSLWTAKYTIEQNRELYSLPGSIFSKKSEGTNNLLRKQMAAPAISTEQILEDLDLVFNPVKRDSENRIKFDNEFEKIIFENLNFEPIHVDELSVKCNLEISKLVVYLLNMEFSQLIRQLPGNLVIRNI